MDKIEKRKIYLDFLNNYKEENSKDMSFSFDNINYAKQINENNLSISDNADKLLSPSTYDYVFNIKNIEEKGKLILEFSQQFENQNNNFDLYKYNNFIINKFKDILNEKMSVADDIEEWYELIYDIMIIQSEGFMKAVKRNPKKYRQTVTIDEKEFYAFNAEIHIPEDDINELIDEKISEDNKLKLRDLGVIFSITLLKEEDFSNYLFDPDAFYNDSNAEFDGEYLNGSEIYMNIYLPYEESIKYNIDVEKILNDYEINLKFSQSISHELDHAYEFFQRLTSGEEYFPEKALNDIQMSMENHSFTEVSDNFSDFLTLCYIALTFEGSARITEIYYYLNEHGIKDVADFWSHVKQTSAWTELNYLKTFDPEIFYDNISFNLPDDEIQDVLILTNVATEDEIEKIPVKTLVIRYWLKLFDEMIQKVNIENNFKIKRITKTMFDNPLEFFKYYDKKFKKSWDFFFKRISKMSSKYNK